MSLGSFHSPGYRGSVVQWEELSYWSWTTRVPVLALPRRSSSRCPALFPVFTVGLCNLG